MTKLEDVKKLSDNVQQSVWVKMLCMLKTGGLIWQSIHQEPTNNKRQIRTNINIISKKPYLTNHRSQRLRNHPHWQLFLPHPHPQPTTSANNDTVYIPLESVHIFPPKWPPYPGPSHHYAQFLQKSPNLFPRFPSFSLQCILHSVAKW